MTPDLQTARIYYTSVFGSDKQKLETSEAGLDESRTKIRAHLGKVLKMRYTPKLEFFVDEGLEQVATAFKNYWVLVQRLAT